ncbi:unnamed protein product [Vitrella brassicaformis CCMP3155]|uniref:Uncharacterized protein n=2 Tax=Vitrella brassicaformis TaxID=1169539 RepID=A0A0G4G8M2_VITBC|nr:unnamed protein product [Vitrella brassicaformis CCMP3155]|eukprot:CEM25186.1 unnamed protein product [Vitrella brassicaformis CCMP3155]
MPPGCLGLDDVDIVPGRGVTGVTQQLMEGCIRRTFTFGAQVTSLIRERAFPGASGSLRVRGTRGTHSMYSCLCFAIDSPTNRPFLYASGARKQKVPVVLPQWSSRQLQRDVINALIDGGADINAAGGEERLLKMGIAAGNLTAVEVLLERQANVRGFGPLVMELPDMLDAAPSVTREYEAALISVYRRLIRHDSTLPAEWSVYGNSLVHLAATAPSIFSQQVIDQYLDLITSHGVDTTAANHAGFTPLHIASRGSPCVAEWLCRQLTADDVNRGMPNQPHRTPLAIAADDLIQEQQQRQLGEGRARYIRNYKTTIGVLLRGGAAPSIARMPTATDMQRRRRQLVLAEYATVLSELSEAAEAIGWKIGAFLHEPPAAVAAIDQYLVGESVLRRRVRAAVGHFVKSAATQTSSNREVVGGTRYQQQGDKRVKVTVPLLQCFAVGGQQGGQHRLLGVREVVHRARLDEAATHGMRLVKGFNEHLGDQDCQFEWGQLGRIDKGTGMFVSLGID